VKPHAIISSSPLKVHTQLEVSEDGDFEYGWGIYLHEGFAIPESIRALTLFLMFCFILSGLVFCATSVGKYGMDVFSIWEGSIALCALLAMFLFRYSDSRA
jgi:hypothetical protein